MAPRETAALVRTYIAGAAAVVPDLTGVTGGPPPSRTDPAEVRRVYYDLADRSLLRHGITLAGPGDGQSGTWCLAFPARLARLDLEVGPAGSGRIPPEVLERIRGHVRDRPLAPLAQVTARRQVGTYSGRDGAAILRVTEEVLLVDGGTAVARRWSVEAPGGGPLDAVETLLVGAGAAPGNAAASLRGIVGEPPAGTSPARLNGSVGAVLATAFRAEVAGLMIQDARVRAGEEGAVRELRVCSRTLASLLRTFGPLLEKDTALERRLQYLGRILSAARDAEMVRARIHESTLGHPAGTVPGHVVRRLHRNAAEEYRQAHDALRQELDSPAYFRLLDRLEDFSTRPRVRAGGQKTRNLLRSAAKRQQRRMRAVIAAAAREQDPAERPRRLHDVRKRSRRLRYAVRSVSSAAGVGFGKKLDASTALAKDIQDALGTHRDSVLFQGYLARTAQEAHRSGANTFAYGVLHQAEVPRQAAAEKAYRSAVRRLR